MAEAADELSTPLGQKTGGQKRRFRLPFTAMQALAVLLGLFLVAFIGVVLFNDNPLGGEPIAHIALRQTPVANEKAATVAYPAEPAMKSTAKQAAPAENKTVTIIDGSSGARHDVVIGGGDSGAAKADTETAPAAMTGVDPRLLEKSRYGMIPVVADSLKPFTAYAGEADRAKAAKMPVIAIVVAGLGVGAAKTTDAIMKLPPAVTLAFTPYGADPTKLAERARAQRHEILLQIPMEPFDYPDNDPGQTLLNANAEQNPNACTRPAASGCRDCRLHGRAVAADPVIQPVIREAAKRGLSYLRWRNPAQRRRHTRRGPGAALRQGRFHHRRGAHFGRNRPDAGEARNAGQGTRGRRRGRLGAADLDRAAFGLDQDAGCARHHACAIDNGDAEIKIRMRINLMARFRTPRASAGLMGEES